ncbi:MAG: HD domain-containing protein, partial [Clostridium sp.]|nr:HD domain-containing protein [Clostridium sp.]
DDMYDLLISYINRIENKYIKEITHNLVMEKKDEIMYYPAAKSFHHSIEGGLLYHLTTMLRVADSIGSIYDAVNTDLLFAGVILHDLEKINEMDSTELGIVKEYTFEGTLLGHITMGIKNLEKEAEKLGTPDEIRIMLQHMILSHHMEPEYGSPKRPIFLEAEILHHIDTMDARIYDFVNAVENINPGEFSERVWTLDNRNIYKPEFDK